MAAGVISSVPSAQAAHCCLRLGWQAGGQDSIDTADQTQETLSRRNTARQPPTRAHRYEILSPTARRPDPSQLFSRRALFRHTAHGAYTLAYPGPVGRTSLGNAYCLYTRYMNMINADSSRPSF